MSVIEDRGLRELCEMGAIDPYNPALVQPASIDLRLGTSFLVQDTNDIEAIDLADVPSQERLTKLVERPLYRQPCNCDGSGEIWLGSQGYGASPGEAYAPCPCKGMGWLINDEGRFVIHPGEFVLGSTLERVRVPDDYAMQIAGKSSIARLGLLPHVEAGWFDPGWDGVGTLEMVNLSRVPIILRPGLPICQSKWMRMDRAPEMPYSGRYQGATTVDGSRYEG